MIRAILRLEETTAREIMVPRLDIVAAPVDTSLKRLNEMMLEGGHSRIPLFEETIDTIVGIIHARDLLRFLGQPQEVYNLLEIARPPLFIPDSKPLDELLVEFQEKRSHLAIAVDEYGGTAGVVSIEDLLEEIVGEIADEFDVGEPEIEMVNDQQAVMDARVSLEQVNYLFSTRIEGDGFDTLGGLVYSELGRIPNPGDEVHSNGLRVQVISTLGRRIKKARVLRNIDS
jgi:CBS domain containing-hemolysin-like protein